MAEAPQVVETDPDFEPLPRQRSCTWPLPRPEFSQSNSSTSSPAPSGGAAANPDAAASLASASAVSADFMSNLSLLEESEDFARAAAAAAGRGLCGDFQGAEAGCVHPAAAPQPPPAGPLSQPPPVPPAAAGPLAGQPRKSSSSRRNAWGNLSYADLITKAIESSAEKRLTLSQIYEWMVKSVPYFKDKGDSNSSAGWKVRGAGRVCGVRKCGARGVSGRDLAGVTRGCGRGAREGSGAGPGRACLGSECDSRAGVKVGQLLERAVHLTRRPARGLAAAFRPRARPGAAEVSRDSEPWKRPRSTLTHTLVLRPPGVAQRAAGRARYGPAAGEGSEAGASLVLSKWPEQVVSDPAHGEGF